MARLERLDVRVVVERMGGAGAQQDIAELPDVARPRVAVQHAEPSGIDSQPSAPQKVLGEPRDVLSARAKRWDLKHEGRYPMQQVTTELARLDHHGDVTMRRRHDPDIDSTRPVCSERGDLAGLEDAQQRGLGRPRELTDLVEEEGPSVGPGEVAVSCSGPRKRAGRRAKELGFNELAGDGAAVDRDVRPIWPARRVVAGSGDELLATACLAADVDWAVERRDSCDLAAQGLNARALAEDGGDRC